MKRVLIGFLASAAFVSQAFGQAQPIALPGLYTIAPGPDNLQTIIPASSYCYNIAWAVDRPGGAGYMAADCGRSPAAWVTNAGPQGLPGATGAPGADGNTVLSGTGAPSAGFGKNGDYYLDVTVTRLYGPKISGVWGTGVLLIGPAGAPGAPGTNGANGSNGSSATIAVGSVTTLPPGSLATAVNSGTASAAVIDFGLPAGVAGANGTNGTNGANGAPGVNAFAVPVARTLALGTAYQATNTAKPAIITINMSSAAALSLTAGATNSAEIVIGPTSAVASGTGTVVGRYNNSLTGTLVVGLAVSTTSAAPITISIPAGYYFAVRQTSGTVSITSAFDQAVG